MFAAVRHALTTLAIVALSSGCASTVVPCPQLTHGDAPRPPGGGGFVRQSLPGGKDELARAGRPLTNAELDAFESRHDRALLEIRGIKSLGRVTCSDGQLCFVVQVLAGTPGADTLATTLARMLDDDHLGDVGFRVDVMVEPIPLPRCARGDCGPVDYERRCHAPRQNRRRPVYRLSRAVKAECNHDGECMTNGCGNVCSSYREGSLVGTCELRTDLEDAFCGCVQGQCAWFR